MRNLTIGDINSVSGGMVMSECMAQRSLPWQYEAQLVALGLIPGVGAYIGGAVAVWYGTQLLTCAIQTN